MKLNEQIQHIVDRQEITRLIHTYARAMDRLDVDLLRSIYHPGATEDRGKEMFVGSADELAGIMIKILGRYYFATQHFIGNVIIDLEGDVAWGETYVQGYHRYLARRELPSDPPQPGTREVIQSARYLDRFERRDGIWKIAYRRTVMDWARTQTASDKWFEDNPGVNRQGRTLEDSSLKAYLERFGAPAWTSSKPTSGSR